MSRPRRERTPSARVTQTCSAARSSLNKCLVQTPVSDTALEIKSAPVSRARPPGRSYAGTPRLPRTDKFSLLTTGGLISVRRSSFSTR